MPPGICLFPQPDREKRQPLEQGLPIGRFRSLPTPEKLPPDPAASFQYIVPLFSRGPALEDAVHERKPSELSKHSLRDVLALHTTCLRRSGGMEPICGLEALPRVCLDS